MWLECECGLAFEFVVAGVGFRVGFPVGCRFGFGGLSSGVCFVCVFWCRVWVLGVGVCLGVSASLSLGSHSSSGSRSVRVGVGFSVSLVFFGWVGGFRRGIAFEFGLGFGFARVCVGACGQMSIKCV